MKKPISLSFSLSGMQDREPVVVREAFDLNDLATLVDKDPALVQEMMLDGTLKHLFPAIEEERIAGYATIEPDEEGEFSLERWEKRLASGKL